MKKLVFENKIQATLFEIELQGQISDGMWENSKPSNHYKVWCECEVTFSDKESEQGKNFWAQKDNYNLSSKNLLEYIGDRMISICNLTEKGFSKKDIELLNDASSYIRPMENIEIRIPFGSTSEEILKLYEDNHWVKKRKEIEAICPLDELKELCSGPYDMKKLKKELGRMKKIMKKNI